MALINLSLIGELALEALSNYESGESHCYNSKSRPMPDDVFVVLVKTYKQAKNLHSKLDKLHQVCTDFAAGNFDAYIDEFEKWKETDEEAFDPFNELESCFGCSSVDDLPPQIEQYRELLSLSQTFAEARKRKWEAFEKFFGAVPRYYQATDETGETVMIPESELPESFRHQQAVNKEIADVQVEYCLDGYNQFYQQATGLLSAHMGGDIQVCAQAILSLFSQPKAATN